MSRNSSFLLSSNPNNNNKHASADADQFLKMGPDFFPQNQQNCGGLERYRSAPSSFLAALLDSNTDNSSSGDESDAFFTALLENQNSTTNQMQQYPMKQEVGADTEHRARLPDPQTGGFGYESGGTVVGSYSVGMESQVQMSNGNGNRNCSSNLIRQSSSPAGFFNGFSVMGEVGGNYRVQNQDEASSSAAAGLTNHINFPSSTSRFMPSIPENVNDNAHKFNSENGRSRNGNGREFQITQDSWNESPGLKRTRDGDLKSFSKFNGLENENGETRKKASGLVSHLSLPKTSAEMAVVENMLQFQQETTIPCQIRAKRGFATHPRSIAERNRRTRISDNMKKLQDLFPDMDKQINTADMLDLAVGYIKDLQKQVQNLNDTKAKCVCSSGPQQTSPET